MKALHGKLLLLPFLTFFVSFTLVGQDVDAADSTGLAGDHFSLEGALELFKGAESPEAFEKSLNTEQNGVNNLDLNEDGKIDYIRVIDRMDGDAHAIVLQALVNEKESQDVAVIEIEKTGPEEAILQIVGDEDLYGPEVLVEPFEEEQTKQGRHGPAPDLGPVRIVVNVWGWPSVRYMYRPGYVVYVSPWRWAAYPGWWRPWRPHPWRAFQVRAYPFRARYHVVSVHRVPRAHRVYTPHRVHSTTVHSRTVVHHGRHGNVKATRTTKTTKVQGPRGGTRTTKTTTVRRGRRN